MGGPPAWGLGEVLTISHHKNIYLYFSRSQIWTILLLGLSLSNYIHHAVFRGKHFRNYFRAERA